MKVEIDLTSDLIKSLEESKKRQIEDHAFVKEKLFTMAVCTYALQKKKQRKVKK